MARLTIRSENLFAAIARRQFGNLLAASRTSRCFLCGRRRPHRIEAPVAEVSGVTPEIRASKKYRQSVDRDQPNRKRFGTDAWFAFFALHSGVDLLDIGLFAVIHPLANARWRFRFVVHYILILQERAMVPAMLRPRAQPVRR